MTRVTIYREISVAYSMTQRRNNTNRMQNAAVTCKVLFKCLTTGLPITVCSRLHQRYRNDSAHSATQNTAKPLEITLLMTQPYCFTLVQ